jgi:hypothetical protein|mmetsp:Transcript_4855/g.8464  ORF Transcript_4855/g.8464 Transcript_4855/m.8464 type:complete len:85 (-) Transcript_4855:1005-1259(-)
MGSPVLHGTPPACNTALCCSCKRRLFNSAATDLQTACDFEQLYWSLEATGARGIHAHEGILCIVGASDPTQRPLKGEEGPVVRR